MTTVIQAITGVFTEIGTWITTTLGDFSEVFYADGGLTFIGTLSIASLGIGLVMLLINKVKDFLQFRA